MSRGGCLRRKREYSDPAEERQRDSGAGTRPCRSAPIPYGPEVTWNQAPFEATPYRQTPM